jgi:hypothetical protein
VTAPRPSSTDFARLALLLQSNSSLTSERDRRLMAWLLSQPSEADERLRSAAPDLYAALKWFVYDIDNVHTIMTEFNAAVDRARAALAQAEGRDLSHGLVYPRNPTTGLSDEP